MGRGTSNQRIWSNKGQIKLFKNQYHDINNAHDCIKAVVIDSVCYCRERNNYRLLLWFVFNSWSAFLGIKWPQTTVMCKYFSLLILILRIQTQIIVSLKYWCIWSNTDDWWRTIGRCQSRLWRGGGHFDGFTSCYMCEMSAWAWRRPLSVHFNLFYCLGCNGRGARRWCYLQPGPQQLNCRPWRGGLFFSFTALMVSATGSECCNPANVAINSNSISLAWGEIVMHFLSGLF